MTVISGLAPHPSNNLLITSEAEHLRLIAQEVSAKSIPILHVAHLVAQYAHNKSLTDWYTALSRLGTLPEQIPPLDLNINEIIDGICPIRGSFYLLPRGTLNELEALVSAYGKEHLAAFGGENPLQFIYFSDSARQDHAETQLDKDEWRWMSDDVLEGNRNRPYEELAQMVAKLGGKLGANFEIPSFRDAAWCLFLHQVATRESVLQQGNEQNRGLSTFTRVQDSRLVIGGSAPSGVHVYGSYGPEHIGVVALRKL